MTSTADLISIEELNSNPIYQPPTEWLKEADYLTEKVINGTFKNHQQFIKENLQFIENIRESFPDHEQEFINNYIESQNFCKYRTKLLKQLSKVVNKDQKLVRIIKKYSPLYKGEEGIGIKYFVGNIRDSKGCWIPDYPWLL